LPRTRRRNQGREIGREGGRRRGREKKREGRRGNQGGGIGREGEEEGGKERESRWRDREGGGRRRNFLPPSRTNSYEYRLWKYSNRGFGVGVPGLVRRRINPEVYTKGYAELSGFSKLLFFEV
jgi:hypothetical protein